MLKQVNNEIVKKIIQDYFNVKEPFNIYSKTIVYEENNKIIGILVYEEIYDRIEIDYLLVLEEYRKKGIGRSLVEYLKDKQNVTLEVRSSNKIAIEFYQKCGFQIVARRDKYYSNEDGYLMQRM